MLSHFNCVWLFTILWTVAHQAPLFIRFSRQEYWSELPFIPPGDLPNPGREPESLRCPVLEHRFFTTNATWEAPCIYKGFSGGSDSKESACNARDQGSTPSWEGALGKGMATHSSILAWRTPWTEESGRLQFIWLQRVVYSWVTNTSTSHYLRKCTCRLCWVGISLENGIEISSDDYPGTFFKVLPLFSPWRLFSKSTHNSVKTYVLT